MIDFTNNIIFFEFCGSQPLWFVIETVITCSQYLTFLLEPLVYAMITHTVPYVFSLESSNKNKMYDCEIHSGYIIWHEQYFFTQFISESTPVLIVSWKLYRQNESHATAFDNCHAMAEFSTSTISE